MRHMKRTKYETVGVTSGSTPEMRAIVQDHYGGPGALTLRLRPRPQPRDGEVVVEVHAAGVDRGVWHLMRGMPRLVRLGYGLRRPAQAVPGLDLAGRVAAVGAGVTRFAVGDAVCGVGIGAYADYARAREDKLVLKPEVLGWEAAAALPISGLTAQQAVVDIAAVAAGQRVLVLGASGGVGSYAVQLARAAGAEVTGVCSAAKVDFVRSLGADHVVDYAEQDATATGVLYDAIVDVGGRTSIPKLRRALARRGTLAVVGGEGGGAWTGGFGRQIRAALLSPFVSQRLAMFVATEQHTALARLAARVQAGEVVPAVSTTYPLERAADALADLEAGRIRGKAVISVRAEG